MIREVETEIDYGNLSPEAAALVKKDSAGVPLLMSQLLSGLPVDSVGWAESVSESAGRELLKEILPEFTANFEVTSGRRQECGSPHPAGDDRTYRKAHPAQDHHSAPPDVARGE